MEKARMPQSNRRFSDRTRRGYKKQESGLWIAVLIAVPLSLCIYFSLFGIDADALFSINQFFSPITGNVPPLLPQNRPAMKTTMGVNKAMVEASKEVAKKEAEARSLAAAKAREYANDDEEEPEDEVVRRDEDDNEDDDDAPKRVPVTDSQMKEAEEAFAEADADGDSSLSATELQKALSELNPVLSDQSDDYFETLIDNHTGGGTEIEVDDYLQLISDEGIFAMKISHSEL